MTCATVWRSPFEPTAAAERCLQRAFHQFVPSNGASLGQMSIGRDLAGLPKAGLEEKADRLLELELIRLARAERGNLICDGHGRHRAEILERAAEGTNRQQSPTARWTRSGPVRAEQWRRAHRCSRRRQRPHHWGLLQITTHLHAQLRRSRPVPGLQRHETLARRASSNEPDSSTPPPEAPQLRSYAAGMQFRLSAAREHPAERASRDHRKRQRPAFGIPTDREPSRSAAGVALPKGLDPGCSSPLEVLSPSAVPDSINPCPPRFLSFRRKSLPP